MTFGKGIQLKMNCCLMKSLKAHFTACLLDLLYILQGSKGTHEAKGAVPVTAAQPWTQPGQKQP